MILANWSYKRKFLLLIFGAVLLFTIAWRVSISPTLELVKTCNDLQSQVAGSDAAYVELSDLQFQLEHLEDLLGEDNLDANEVQLKLLNQVERFSEENELLIKEVLPIHESAEEDYLIYTHIIVVEGNFRELLELSHNLEQQFKLARLGAVHFDKETSLRTGKQTLYATLYVQKVWKT